MTKAIWEGAVLAESDDTVIIEGNHYFPPESLNRIFSAQQPHKRMLVERHGQILRRRRERQDQWQCRLVLPGPRISSLRNQSPRGLLERCENTAVANALKLDDAKRMAHSTGMAEKRASLLFSQMSCAPIFCHPGMAVKNIRTLVRLRPKRTSNAGRAQENKVARDAKRLR
jgi:Domain of unknown function (DUF427)